MDDIIFKSQTNNQIAYTVHDSSSSFDSNFSSYCSQFDTYNDGLTQHSPKYHIGQNNTLDFLGSLCFYLAEHIQDANVLERILPNIDKREILFLRSVKFTEGKDQYYSIAEGKISGSIKKQYDKRWEHIEKWCDGTIKSIYELYVRQNPYYSVLEKIWTVFCIRQYLQEYQKDTAGEYWCISNREILSDICKNQEKDINGIAECLNTLYMIKKAHSYTAHTKSCLDCLRNNWLVNGGYVKEISCD